MGKISLQYLQRNKEAAATFRITRAVKFTESDKILSRFQSNQIIKQTRALGSQPVIEGQTMGEI